MCVVRILCVLLQFSDANVCKHAPQRISLLLLHLKVASRFSPTWVPHAAGFFTGISSGISIWMETNHQSAVLVIRAPVTFPLKRRFSAMLTQPSGVEPRCDDHLTQTDRWRDRSEGALRFLLLNFGLRARPSKNARLRLAYIKKRLI